MKVLFTQPSASAQPPNPLLADVADTFGGTAGSPIDGTRALEVGGVLWQLTGNGLTGTPQVNQNRAVGLGVTAGLAQVTAEIGTNNYDVLVTLNNIDTDVTKSTAGVVVGLSNSTSWARVAFRETAAKRTYTLLDQSGTKIVTNVTPQAGDVIRVKRRGQTYELIVNGITLGSATLTNVFATKAGLQFTAEATLTYFKNFFVYRR